MSFLDFFIWKEKPKVVLTPEAPVKAPETLLTLKTPITPAKRSLLEEIQQADSAARVTPVKAPVAPRKSMLEQIQEWEAWRSVIGGEFTPTPIDVVKTPFLERSNAVPSYLNDTRKSLYKEFAIQSALSPASAYLSRYSKPLEKPVDLYKKNPTENEKIQEFSVLQKSFQDNMWKYSVLDEAKKAGLKWNEMFAVLNAINPLYKELDNPFKLLPTGKDDIILDKKYKDLYKEYPKAKDFVDNFEWKHYENVLNSMGDIKDIWFSEEDLDSIIKNDNTATQATKDTLLSLWKWVNNIYSAFYSSMDYLLAKKDNISWALNNPLVRYTPMSVIARTVLDSLPSESAFFDKKKKEIEKLNKDWNFFFQSPLQRYSEVKPFNWESFWDAWFYIKSAESIPLTLALALPSMGIGSAVGWAVAATGATWATATIANFTISGLVNRAMESATEAWQTYQDLKWELWKDKAENAADYVFWMNMSLVWNDITQFATNFIPAKWAFKVLWGIATDITTESMEEWLQAYFQYSATEKANWREPMPISSYLKTPEAQEAMAVGWLMGGAWQVYHVWAWTIWDIKLNKKLGKIALMAWVNRIEWFDSYVADGIKKKVITEEQGETMKKIYNDAATKSYEEAAVPVPTITQTIKATIWWDGIKWTMGSDWVMTFIIPQAQEKSVTAPAQTITTKQSNALNQKVDTKNAKTMVESAKKILEAQWYTVETKEWAVHKGSASQYLFVSKEGGEKVSMRVSDHTLPEKWVDKHGEPNLPVDLAKVRVVPFDKISLLANGETVKVPTNEKAYEASQRLRDFNNNKANIPDNELLDYYASNSEKQLWDAIMAEIDRRGLDILELENAPVATEKTVVAPRPSFLTQAMTAPQQELVPEYSPGMADLMDQRKSLQKLIKDTQKKNKSLPKSKQIPTKRLRGDLSKLEKSIRSYARKNKETNPILRKKVSAVKQTPQEITQGAIAEFNDKWTATSYLNDVADDFINGKMTMTEFNAAFKTMKQESPSQKFMDEVLEAEAGVVFTINEELRELENSPELQAWITVSEVAGYMFPDTSVSDIKAFQKYVNKNEVWDTDWLNDKFKQLIYDSGNNMEDYDKSMDDDEVFQKFMDFDFTIDDKIEKMNRRVKSLNQKLNQYNNRKKFTPSTPVVVDTTMATEQSPFNIPEALNTAVDEITNFREDMIPIEQISYAIESAENSRVARIEVSKILEDMDATPDTAQAFLDYADARKRNEVEPLSNEAFSETPFELREKEQRDLRIQNAFANGDFQTIVENVGIWGTFSVSWLSVSPADLVGKLNTITPEEYKKRTGDKLKEWDVAYEVVTELLPNEKPVDIRMKSWIWATARNLLWTVGWMIRWIPTFDFLSPIITASGKTVTTKYLNFLGMKHILSAVYDNNTGRSASQILSSHASKTISDREALASLEDLRPDFDKNIFSKKKEWWDAFDKLLKNIDSLIEKPTNNSLNGEEYSKTDREYLRSATLAFALDNNTLSKLWEFSPEEKNALKYYMAIDNMFAHYPKEIRELIWNDLADYLLSGHMKDTTERSPIYTTGWNSLVQMKEAGLKQEDVISGTYHPGANIDPTQALIYKPEDRAYQHYEILANSIVILIPEITIPQEFLWDNIWAYVQKLIIEERLETNQTKKDSLKSQLQRIQDWITKKKWQDELDVFRLHSPRIQKYLYAKHVADVIFQKEALGILKWMNNAVPWSITDTKFSVGLVHDIFIWEAQNNTYWRAKALEKIYGKWKVLTNNIETAKSWLESIKRAIWRAAAAWLSKGTSLTKGLVSLFYSFHDARIFLLDTKWNAKFENFAVQQGLVNNKWMWVVDRGSDSFKLNMQHARAQLDMARKTWAIRTGFLHSDIMNTSLEAAGIFINSTTSFGFTNPIEEFVAYKASQIRFAELVQKETGIEMITESGSLDVGKAVDAFNSIESETKKEDIMDEVKAIIKRNFDSQTQTKSSWRIMRDPFLNFLRQFTMKQAANSVLRDIDAKTYWNLQRNKPQAKVEKNDVTENVPDILNDISNAMSPEAHERLSKNTKISLDVKRRHAIIWTLLITAWIAMVWALRDDEDKPEKFSEEWWIQLMHDFNTVYFFWIRNGMNVTSNMIFGVVQPASVPTKFIVQYNKALYDVMKQWVLWNQDWYDQAWYKLYQMSGMYGTLLDAAINTDEDQVVTDAAGNVLYIREAWKKGWLLDDIIPGDIPYAAQQAAERALKYERATGWWVLGGFFQDIKNYLESNIEMSWNNLTSAINPFGKTNKYKQAMYNDTQDVRDFIEIMKENPTKWLDETIALYVTEDIPELSTYSIKEKIKKWSTTMQKGMKELGFLTGKNELLRNTPFATNVDETAWETWNNLQKNPVLYTAFLDRLIQLRKLKWWPKEERSINTEKILKAPISEPDEKSYIHTIAATITKDMQYDSTLRRSMTYLIDGIKKSTMYEEQNLTNISHIMDQLNTVLALGKNNKFLEKDIFKSLQNLIWKWVLEWWVYETLLNNDVAEPGKYEYINEALIQVKDNRTFSLDEYYAIAKFEPSGIDYEVSQKLINDNKGKMPDVDEDLPVKEEYKKWDTITSPIYWVVGRQKNGVIYITDYKWRHLAFTPFISHLEDGQVIKKWEKMWTASQHTVTTKFKPNWAPARQPKEPLVEIDPTKNYNKDYIEQTGNMETLKNFDYRKYIEAIDFWALSRSIKTWKKTKPKKAPKEKWFQTKQTGTVRKSFLQDFIDSEGK